LPDNSGPGLGFWRQQRYPDRMLSRPAWISRSWAGNRWAAQRDRSPALAHSNLWHHRPSGTICSNRDGSADARARSWNYGVRVGSAPFI